MLNLSKRMQKAAALVSKEVYTLPEALGILHEYKNSCAAKFDETVEFVMKLGIDPRQSDQLIRAAVELPAGRGKDVRIAIIVDNGMLADAEKAGASVVGSDDLVEKIKGGWCDFDVCVASVSMMPKLASLGKVLGPRGLMPNQKLGTVIGIGEKVIDVINRVKGSATFKSDKQGIVHMSVGKISFDVKKLTQNIGAAFGAVIAAKPASSKGVYVKSVFLTSTQGPSIPLSVLSLNDL